MDDLGYVIVEFNQASGRPRLAYHGDVYDNDVDALEDATGLMADNRQHGRLETFAVARLVRELEVPDGEPHH